MSEPVAVPTPEQIRALHDRFVADDAGDDFISDLLDVVDSLSAQYHAEHLKVFANLARAHKAEGKIRELSAELQQTKAERDRLRDLVQPILYWGDLHQGLKLVVNDPSMGPTVGTVVAVVHGRRVTIEGPRVGSRNVEWTILRSDLAKYLRPYVAPATADEETPR